MTDPGVGRAAERVTLACRALSAAANDLRVAHTRDKMIVVNSVAHMLEAETERVCELAEQLATLAANLRRGLPLEAAAKAAKLTANNPRGRKSSLTGSKTPRAHKRTAAASRQRLEKKKAA